MSSMRLSKFTKASYLSFVYAFLYLPIVILIVFSFNNSAYSLLWHGFTFHWYQQLWQDNSLGLVAFHSVEVGIFAATVATLMGTLAAGCLYRYRFFGKRFLHALTFVLIVSPDIVMGISLLILFSVLHVSLGFWSLVLSHITFCLPFVIVTTYSRLIGMDKNIIEAAKDLGADDFVTFRRVLIPLMMPAMIAGWLLSFTLSLDDVIISFFVTGPSFQILPLQIYSLVKLGLNPEINALCTVMFIITLIIILCSQIILKNRRS